MQGSPGVLKWYAGAFFGLSVKKTDLTDNQSLKKPIQHRER